jgi:hypothetical protein
MMEVIMLPEMLAAGEEALTESRERGLDDKNLCIAIFLAMRAVEEIYDMRRDNRSVH